MTNFLFLPTALNLSLVSSVRSSTEREADGGGTATAYKADPGAYQQGISVFDVHLRDTQRRLEHVSVLHSWKAEIASSQAIHGV